MYHLTCCLIQEKFLRLKLSHIFQGKSSGQCIVYPKNRFYFCYYVDLLMYLGQTLALMHLFDIEQLST